jgi:hypothetical protein
MKYAIITNNAITAHGTASQLWPGTSFAVTGPNAAWLDSAGAVLIRQDPPYNTEIQELQSSEPYLLNGVAYNVEAVAKPPNPVVPQWQAFGAAIAADTDTNIMIATAAASAPVLHLMLGVGLGQAAQGDSSTFVTAWTNAIGAGLVTQELAEHVQGLAIDRDLPDDFVQALNPDPWPT